MLIITEQLLSNAISKILEHILYDLIANEDAVDDFQFGFKKGHSTSDCTDTQHQIVHLS